MAKDSRFRFEYMKNASKLHKTVGEVLRTDHTFCYHEIYQEYPVNRVNAEYSNKSHHFDWVIPKLNIVIECHGKQHYQVVAFDGDIEKAISSFTELKHRDKDKKEAALNAGYVYIEVPYTDQRLVSSSYIIKKYQTGKIELEAYTKDNEYRFKLEDETKELKLSEILRDKRSKDNKLARTKYLTSEKHLDTLNKVREIRQKRYKKFKELAKG